MALTPPLLVEDIPRGWDALLSLHTGINVQRVRQQHEEEGRRRADDGQLDDAHPHQIECRGKSLRKGRGGICIMLLHGRTQTDKEEDLPRDANFAPHLEVDAKEAGIEWSTHEEVVGMIARHPMRRLGQGGDGIGNDGHNVGPDDRNHHDGSQVFHNVAQIPDAIVVKDEQKHQINIPRGNAVAVVDQLLVVEAGDGQALDQHTGEESGREGLPHRETKVHLGGVHVGHDGGQTVTPEVFGEWVDALSRMRH